MNKEEKRAIEIYKQAIEDINKENAIHVTIEEFKVYTPALLNLIQKQQEELNKKEWLYQNKTYADWYKFKIFNRSQLLCGLDNEKCNNKACISTEQFNKYGCMYIKGFKDY